MKFSIIIPFSGNDSSRIKCLNKSLDYYKECFGDDEIILVEEGTTTQLPTTTRSRLDKYKLIPPTYKQHTKNKCINEAYKMSSGEYLIIVDSDCIPMSTNARNVLISSKFQACHIGKHVKYVKDRNVLNMTFDEIIKIFPNLKHCGYNFFRWDSCGPAGGGIMIRKDLFKAIGGTNEEWHGICGSDNEFTCRIKLFCEYNKIKWGDIQKFDMIHFPHDTKGWGVGDKEQSNINLKRVIEIMHKGRPNKVKYFNDILKKRFLG